MIEPFVTQKKEISNWLCEHGRLSTKNKTTYKVIIVKLGWVRSCQKWNNRVQNKGKKDEGKNRVHLGSGLNNKPGVRNLFYISVFDSIGVTIKGTAS